MTRYALPKALPALCALALASFAQADETPLSQVVVTATRTAQDLRDVPAAVSVIDREQIEQSAAATVDQLLQGLPGVYAARMDPSSPNRIAQTYTRGLPGNSRTLVLLDGIPMNVLYDGQVDWSQLATQDVERVEVVRGASSGLYGANAMGGVINILSRAPEPGVVTQVGAEYGSMDSTRLSASHSRSLDGLAVRVSASHFESDGYLMWRPDTTVPLAHRAAIGTVKDNLSARLVRDLDATRILEAGLSYLRDEATGFYRPGAPGYRPQTREQVVPTLRYSQEDGAAATSVVAYGRFGRQWADTLNPATYAAISERGEYRDRSLGLNAQHTRPLTASQRLTVGADYLDGRIDNHFTYPGSARLRDTLGDLARYGVFLQDEIALSPAWLANVAGRYDHWQTGGNQTDTGAGQPSTAYASRSGSGWSPKFGTLYRLTGNANLRASAGRAFNLPDMFNLYANTRRGTTTYWANPGLEPERVRTYDLGLDYYFGTRGHVKVTAYRNDAEDFIYSIRRDASNFDKVNVGKVRTEGVEFEALFRPLDHLTLSASYTVNDSVVVRNAKNTALEGKHLINVPDRQGQLRADWTWGNGARAHVAVSYVGDRFGDDANATVYRNYTVYDLGGSYPLGKSVTLRLNCANVTGEKYEGIGYIAPGTTITAGVSARF